MVKQAIIKTKAPIIEWNGAPLPADVVEARRLLDAKRLLDVAAMLHNIPSAEKLAAVDKELSEARATLNQKKIMVEVYLKEEAMLDAQGFHQDRDLAVCISELEHELSTLKAERLQKGKANKNKLTDIAHKIAQAKLAMEQLRAVVIQREKYQAEVETLRAQLSHLLPAPTPPPEDPNLCGICYERNKNRAFMECGHLFCDVCAGQVLDDKKIYSTCRTEVARAFQVYL